VLVGVVVVTVEEEEEAGVEPDIPHPPLVHAVAEAEADIVGV
jgi:hypothetical protein